MERTNSFALLSGGDDHTPSSKKKKKKHCVRNRSVSIPDFQNLDDDLDEFEVVSHGKTGKRQGTHSVYEYGSIDLHALEQAAEETEDLARLQQLMYDWHTKVLADLGFKQALLKSHAVDRLLQNLLAFPAENCLETLSHLLTALAHPSLSSTFGPSLANLVLVIARMNAYDPMAPRSQALGAITAALAVLKNGAFQQPLSPSSSTLSTTLMAMNARLDSLQSDVERATTSKEKVSIATVLWETALTAAQFEEESERKSSATTTFAPPAPSEATTAALRALATLRTAFSTRQQALTHPENVKETAAAAVVEKEKQRGTDADGEADVALAAEEAKAEAHLEELERQLAEARAAVQEIKARRAAKAKEKLMTTMTRLETYDSASSATQVDLVTGLATALKGIDEVDAALQQAPPPPPPATAAAGGSLSSLTALFENIKVNNQVSVPKKKTTSETGGMSFRFVAATQLQLDLLLRHLKELSSKAVFYRDRLTASSRQAEHVLLLKDAKIIAEHAKQRESFQSKLSDVLAAAAAAEQSANATHQAWQRQWQADNEEDNTPITTTSSSSSNSTSESIGAVYMEISAVAQTISSGLPPSPSEKPKHAAHPTTTTSTTRSTTTTTTTSVAGDGGGGSTCSGSELSGRYTPLGSVSATTQLSRSSEDGPLVPLPPSSPSHHHHHLQQHTLSSSSTPSSMFASELAALEHRLSTLEVENKKKDKQIAAMMAAASFQIPRLDGGDSGGGVRS